MIDNKKQKCQYRSLLGCILFFWGLGFALLAQANNDMLLWTQPAHLVSGQAESGPHTNMTKNNQEVYISGEPIGIFMRTKGVLVIDTGEYNNTNGKVVSPCKDILYSGDYILKVNQKVMRYKKEISESIQNCKGKCLVFTIERNGEISEVSITPELDPYGNYKIGAWLRDSAQGIGTVTYLTKDGHFGALGHGIGDVDTQTILHLKKGSIYATNILGITRGSEGVPGQLSGVISYEKKDYLGRILKNNEIGIYGMVEKMQQSQTALAKEKILCQVAKKEEIKRGLAQIYCDVDGAADFYDVKIERIAWGKDADHREMLLKVIDEKLLQKTGGIVQGMSGSPIVQNGKLIGAVTHVFVNNPTKGYGIFTEEMLANE